MGSKTLLTVLWFVATAVAATVAWQSLSFVSATTEGEPASPALADAGDRPLDATSPDGRTTPTSPPPSASTATTTSSPTSSSVPSPTDSAAPASTTASSATGSSTTATEQIFDLPGGRVAISFTPAEVRVIWATPAAGYTVESHPDDGGIEVEFSNGIHESKIEAWWADGPRFETRERAD